MSTQHKSRRIKKDGKSELINDSQNLRLYMNFVERTTLPSFFNKTKKSLVMFKDSFIRLSFVMNLTVAGNHFDRSQFKKISPAKEFT